VARSPMDEMKSTMDETRQMVNYSIMPPNFGDDVKTAVNKDDAAVYVVEEEANDGNEADIIIPSPPLTLPSLIDVADDPE